MTDVNEDTEPSTESDEDEGGGPPPDLIVKLPENPEGSSRSFGPLSPGKARATGVVVSMALSFAARRAELGERIETAREEGGGVRRRIPLTSGPAPARGRAALDARIEVTVERDESEHDGRG